jgi:hypothetical protein
VNQKWIGVVLKFGPLIARIVQVIEDIMHGEPGEKKLDAAVKLLLAFLKDVEGTAVDEKVVEALKAAINAVVALNNAIAAAKAVKAPRTTVSVIDFGNVVGVTP